MTHFRPALALGRLCKERGCPEAVRALARGRCFQFGLGRAAFLTVLHRLFGPGPGRAAGKRKRGCPIEGPGQHRGRGQDRLQSRFSIRRICIVAGRGMISQKMTEAPGSPQPGWGCILGGRMRNGKEARQRPSAGRGAAGAPPRGAPPSSRAKGPAPLKVKSVAAQGCRKCLRPSLQILALGVLQAAHHPAAGLVVDGLAGQGDDVAGVMDDIDAAAKTSRMALRQGADMSTAMACKPVQRRLMRHRQRLRAWASLPSCKATICPLSRSSTTVMQMCLRWAAMQHSSGTKRAKGFE